MNRPYIILSVPRSGSNFVSSILREHEEINLQIEPFNQYLKFASDRDLEIWSEETFSFQTFHKDIAWGSYEYFYLRDFQNWANSGHDSFVQVFKETTFSLKLKWLLCYLPNLRYIFLLRSPHRVVNSLLKANLIAKWSFHDKLKRVLGQNGHLLPEVDVDSLDDYEVGAYVWYIGTWHMLQFYKAYPSKVTWKSYERILEDVRRGFERLLAEFGKLLTDRVIQEIDEKTSVSKGGTYSTYRDVQSVQGHDNLVIGDSEIARIKSLCGEIYRECCSFVA